MKSHEEYNDKLMIKIDWLSFTVQKSMTPKGVIEYFGMDIEEFKEEARGLNGYRKQYTYRVNGNNGLIRVLYDGQMGMGVQLTFPALLSIISLKPLKTNLLVIRLLVRKHSSFLRILIFKTKKILLCFFWLIFAVSQSLPVSTWLSMILHLSSPWEK